MVKKIKKKVVSILIVIAFFAVSNSCGNKSGINSEPYFGQKPPGDSAQLFAPGIVSTGIHEMNICISIDLKSIYVGKSSINWSSSIVLYQLDTDGWKNAELPSFTKGLKDNYPFLSPDNNRIYFNTSRQLGNKLTGRRIWYSDNKNGQWSIAKQLDIDVAPEIHLTYPSVAKSGNIYLNSTIEGGYGKSDIYMFEKTENGYSQSINLGESINTAFYEFHPYISPDEDFIIFDALREDGYGRNDLYISFKNNDGEWGEAINMGPKVNTEYSDMRAYVSPDGKYLFFCSNRSNIQEDNQIRKLNYTEFENIANGPGNGSQDIYWINAKIIDELKSKQPIK